MNTHIDVAFRRAVRPALLFVCGIFFSGAVFSQAPAPATGSGTTSTVVGSIDLGSEIGDPNGRQLRARLVTIEPGGHLPIHNHKGRPTLEYVVQGNIVEVRNGVEIEHSAGEMIVATHEVSHWWENRSKAPAILLPVDVFKPEAK